ncbi:MAG: GNAT family N-acetyltransferase [Steroidobacteraceae bacterium]
MVKPLIEHIVTEDALLALEPEWRNLESRMVKLPFVRFDWVIPWWRHLSTQAKTVRDELFVITFRTAEDGLLGIAPMMLTHRPNLGPLQFRQLQFFGADPNLTEVRGVAATAENMSLIYTWLLDHLGQMPLKWNSAALTGLPAEDLELQKNINLRYATNYWGPDIVNPILLLKPTWEEFRTGLPRNVKESLRKCYNSPKRDGLSFDFEIVSDPADVESALALFFLLHRARSRMPNTVTHLDNFVSLRSQRFLADVCARFAQRGLLRIFQLKYKGAVIATRLGFALGDTLYLYFSGYDPNYRKYSVATTLVAESIKYGIANGFRLLNMSTGRDVSKSRWAPFEVLYRGVEFSPQSRKDILKHRSYRALLKYLRRRPADSWIARTFSRPAR